MLAPTQRLEYYQQLYAPETCLILRMARAIDDAGPTRAARWANVYEDAGRSRAEKKEQDLLVKALKEQALAEHGALEIEFGSRLGTRTRDGMKIGIKAVLPFPPEGIHLELDEADINCLCEKAALLEDLRDVDAIAEGAHGTVQLRLGSNQFTIELVSHSREMKIRSLAVLAAPATVPK